MRSKVAFLFLFYLVFTMLLNSCLSYEAKICDISFGPLFGPPPNDSTPHQFADRIGFEVAAWGRDPGMCLNIKAFGFTEAYATTKCAKYVNHLVASSFVLSFDRPIVVDNDTLEPGANALSAEGISNLIDVRVEEDCEFVFGRMEWRDELRQKMVFEPGVYRCDFSCETTDGKRFQKSIEVIFNN
ncbi:MAG TPA: hypothetical protein VFV37_06245 [Luteibaculaceae bacterium]|nr:hypothetical protein [Luteibaculaceae bacterium]